MLKLIHGAGSNCRNMLEYHKYFKRQVKKEFTYINNLKGKIKTKLLLKLNDAKTHLLNSWGDFQRMGIYLGHIFSAFRMFKPVSKKKILLKKKKILFDTLKNEGKRDKLEKALKKKYKELIGEEIEDEE